MQHINTPLTFSQYYENSPGQFLTEELELKKRLQTLCRTETIKYCVYLNLYVSNLERPLSTFSAQSQLLREFLNNDEEVSKFGIRAKERPVFSRAQLLEMIQQVALHCPKINCQSPVNSKRSKGRFIQAMLLASEIAMNRVINEKEFVEITPSRSVLLSAVRRATYSGFQMIDPARAFGRGNILFSRYLPKKCTNFLHDFKSQNGLSLEQYFLCLMIIYVHYTSLPEARQLRHRINIYTLSEQLPHLTDVLKKYMELESQDIDELKASLETSPQSGLKVLRTRPILRLNEQESIVIDPYFHLEKPMVSPLFMMSRKIKNLLGYFGKAFEEYAKDILRKMYPPSYPSHLIVDKELMVGGDEIIDACLVEDNNLLLFEMKAKWIPDDEVMNPDHTKYLTALREKYGDGNNAAFQLARATNNLISRKWQLPGHDISKIKRIYPILVPYDPALSVKGHFWFFASEFRKAFEADSMLEDSKTLVIKSNLEVAPITIMPINILEDLELSVENFKLSTLLSNYFKFCDQHFIGIDGDLSLPEFIGKSERYKQRMNRSGTVIQEALKVFDEMKQTVNPTVF